MTTLFLGIPSSSGTAVLFSALLALGIAPGTHLLAENTSLVWTFLWALFLANLLSALVFLGSAGLLVRVVSLSRNYLFPVALTLALTGIFLSAFNWETFIIVFLLGALGTFMKHHGWPRAPFALAVILGRPGEVAFHQSLAIWGPGFLWEPFSLFIFALIAMSLLSSWRRWRKQANRISHGSLPLHGLFFLAFLVGGLIALGYPAVAAALPLAACALGMAATAWSALRDFRMSAQVAEVPRPGFSRPLIWFLAFVACGVVLGVSPGLPLMTTAYLLSARQVRTLWAACTGIGIALVMDILLVELSGLDLFRGLLIENLLR